MDAETIQTYTLSMERVFNTDPQTLFNAWTDPKIISQWFAPGPDMTVPEASADARVGGTYRVVMQNADGEQFKLNGKYVEIDEPTRLMFTFMWEGPDPVETMVTLEFSGQGDKTTMTMQHERFIDENQRNLHEQGWTGSFHKLQGLFSS